MSHSAAQLSKRLERGAAEMRSQRSQRTSNERGPYGGKLHYGGSAAVSTTGLGPTPKDWCPNPNNFKGENVGGFFGKPQPGRFGQNMTGTEADETPEGKYYNVLNSKYNDEKLEHTLPGPGALTGVGVEPTQLPDFVPKQTFDLTDPKTKDLSAQELNKLYARALRVDKKEGGMCPKPAQILRVETKKKMEVPEIVAVRPSLASLQIRRTHAR